MVYMRIITRMCGILYNKFLVYCVICAVRYIAESVKGGTKRRFQVESIDVAVLKLGDAAGVLDDSFDVLLADVTVDVGQVSVHLDKDVDGQRRAPIVVRRQDGAQLFHSLSEALKKVTQ